jgi:hypothetical protein
MAKTGVGFGCAEEFGHPGSAVALGVRHPCRFSQLRGSARGNGTKRKRANDRPFQRKVLACMGPPADRMTVGQTEVWSYQSGNGQTIGSVFASGGNGFASGFGVTEQRFCKVNIVMTKNAVREINYSGPTGGLLTQGEQCAFAVQNCVQP